MGLSIGSFGRVRGAGGGTPPDLSNYVDRTTAQNIGGIKTLLDKLILVTGSTTVTPLQFTSGPLNTTPVAGAIEFLTDKFYGVTTTGATRREFTMNSSALVSTQVTYANVDGQLTGLSTFLFSNTAGGKLSVGTTAQSANLNVGSTVQTAGNNPLAIFTGVAHTGQTASTELSDINFNLARTVQFATGAKAIQRAVLIQAPTYSAVAATTITDAATVAITGSPIVGTFITYTNTYAFWVQSGITRLDGAVTLGGTITPSANITYNLGSSSNNFALVYTPAIASGTGLTFAKAAGSNTIFTHGSGSTIYAGYFSTTGNAFLQAPGTIPTDTTERLQVYGTAKITGNTAIGGNFSAAATILTNLTTTANAVIGTTLSVTGNTTLTIPALGTTASLFLVSNAGVVSSRTAVQLYADLSVPIYTVDATTAALTKSGLNTTYGTQPKGSVVWAPNIIGGGMRYEKSIAANTGDWYSTPIIITS